MKITWTHGKLRLEVDARCSSVSGLCCCCYTGGSSGHNGVSLCLSTQSYVDRQNVAIEGIVARRRHLRS